MTGSAAGNGQVTIDAASTSVFPKFLDRAYPSIDRGEGVWLYTTGGRRILDAVSGGAMTAGLGHGVGEIPDAAQAAMGDIAYYYAHHFTNRPQEQLAARLVEIAPEMAKVRFLSGGSEANETALRLARQYHVDRGDDRRWRVVSPAQAYHGGTMATVALTGRPTFQAPFGPYLVEHLHIPPSTARFDPTGRAALDALDDAIEQAGPESVSAFICEPVSGASLPGYSPPDRFWEGLAERRDQYGFLVCFDEVVTGMGRTGGWFAYQGMPITPDIVTIGKMLGGGYMPLAATMCRQPVYDVLASGSKEFDLGHTWDGAPLSCAVGLAVLDYMERHDVAGLAAERGPALVDRLRAALDGYAIVGEVRGRGFLLGVEYVDPRDGASIPPDWLGIAERIDACALENDLLVMSTHPNADGYAGDQTVFAPALTSTDEELAEMIERFARVVAEVDRTVTDSLANGGTT
ncbi:MAG: aminotransferase class III-fold pyridoxal phosphate-dependent enzyme [bacterium]|nr:aminotransferase class III-fold pyridoxal phosphate-dependent enzyme [bacterium]